MPSETCVACGRTDPPGGLRLGTEGGGAEYEWFCRDGVACAARCAENIQAEKAAGTYTEGS